MAQANTRLKRSFSARPEGAFNAWAKVLMHGRQTNGSKLHRAGGAPSRRCTRRLGDAQHYPENSGTAGNRTHVPHSVLCSANHSDVRLGVIYYSMKSLKAIKAAVT